ncbi:MAG: hypothetical protein ACRYGM_19400 [Janthinobacterium lividum]
MSPTPTQTQADTTARHQAALDELIALGLDLARHIHAKATEQTAQPADPGAEPPRAPSLDQASTAFDRVARTVRRAILLAARLNRPAAPEPQPDPRPRIAARRRIIRGMEDAIGREAEGDHARALQAEFYERLDAPEAEEDLATRPVAEIIEEFRRDLGIAGIAGFPTPWNRRTPAEIAALNDRAATPPKPGFPQKPKSRPAPAKPPRHPPGKPPADRQAEARPA